MKRFIPLLCMLGALLVWHNTIIAQEPDLSRLSGYADKLTAWKAYCESLRLNGSTGKNNYVLLGEAAAKGLAMTQDTDEENHAEFYLYAALSLYYQLKFDSALSFFDRSLRSAEQAHSARLVTRACVAIIPASFQLQQTAKTDSCKNIIQAIADTTRSTALLKDIYYALGSYYQQKSFYSTAQDYFIRSLELREKEVDTTTSTKAKFDYAIQCDMLSKLYLNTQMTDKSLRVLRQAVRFQEVSPTVSNRLMSSFVEAFTTSGLIDSALFYNAQLEKQAGGSGNYPSEIVSSNLNIAIYYIDHHDYAKALPFLTRGDTISARIQSPLLVFQSQMIKGRYLAETGKYDAALPLLQQALPVAKQFSRELYASILKSLALAENEKGNTAAALQYYETYAAQSDSITKQKLAENFADQETRYETNQKEQHIASLNKENRLHLLELQTASRTRLLLVFGLAALGVISLLLFLFYRNKEKVNRVLNRQKAELQSLNGQLETANDTKAKLFAIIGHDLRSPASQIVQLLQIQKEAPGMLTEATRQQHEEKLRRASENVLDTMEDLLLWSKSQMQQFRPQTKPVAIFPLLQKEIHLLQAAADEKQLQVKNTVAENFRVDTDENFVSVIARNLLQNAIKYSTPGSTIEVAQTHDAVHITNTSPEITVAGLNALLLDRKVDSRASGFGLQIANDLASAIGAKIYFELPGQGLVRAVLSFA